MKAAEEFWETLDNLIMEENCLQERIFNIVETSLLWKWMPWKTFVRKETKPVARFKAFKNKMTVLLGGNVASYKLKHSEQWEPRGLQAYQ